MHNAIVLMTLFVTTTAAHAHTVISPMQEQTGLAVTIYNDNLALVKDSRTVNLHSGINSLSFRDVSAQIQPETALLRSLSPSAQLQLLEQNFDFDLLTPQTLLEKFVGQQITVVKTHPVTGTENEVAATVLSTQNGVVLKIGDRIETGFAGRMVFPNVPAGLKDRPTLTTQIQYTGPEHAQVELSYLTGGLQWKADYVAELSNREDALDLSGWVTLTNTSGTRYANAKVQLVAGEVNRVQPVQSKVLLMQAERMAAADMPMPKEQSLMEYHLYTLPKITSIAENQTKQVALLSAQQIPAHKTLVLSGTESYFSNAYREAETHLKVQVLLEFENSVRAKLGIPLPKGIIRVYTKDNDDTAQFVGEDEIDHTAKNATVRLKLGDAFDVSAERIQTDFKTLAKPNQPALYESAHSITLHNAKKKAVTVNVQEPIPGEWKILTASHASKKTSAHQASWTINIPAESDVTLKYRVQVKY